MRYPDRAPSQLEVIRSAMESRQADTWTSLPGIVLAFNPAEMTATVQPAMAVRVRQPDGSVTSLTLPVIPDVPVHFPAGGGYTLTFPVAAGDECWLVFASRAIDQWWLSGEAVQPTDARMHDLSDPCAFVGVRSVPRALSALSAVSTQLRSDDGLTVVDLNGATKKVSVTAPVETIVTAPLTTITGNVVINGNLTVDGNMIVSNTGGIGHAATFAGSITATGDVTGAGTSLHTHTHTGVQTGSGSTGAPN